jgi:diguanylate cyclase (GGDEF)-like protein/PAS domain S-box-containing protein
VTEQTDGNPQLERDLLEFSAEGLALLADEEGRWRVVYANPAFGRLLGAAGDSVSQAPVRELLGAYTDDQGLMTALRERRSFTGTFLRTEGGSEIHGVVELRPWEGAGLTAWLLRIQDTTSVVALENQLDSAHEEIEALDPEDRLTGLKNRRYFDAALRREWAVAAREGRRLTLYLFDLDFFRAYNETFGEQAGDACLKMVGRAIGGCYRRAGDQCARIDGQRFGGLVASAAGHGAEALGIRVAERVRALCIHNPRAPQGKYLTVSAAVVTAAPDRAPRWDELMQYAETVLAEAKGEGRDRVIAREFPGVPG